VQPRDDRPVFEPGPEPEPVPDEVLELVEQPLAHTGASSRSMAFNALLLLLSGAMLVLGSHFRIRKHYEDER